MNNTPPKKKLLVADDNPQIRELLQIGLRDSFEVITAADGPTALSLVANHHPAAVLLETALPNLDGLEVCRRIRRLPNGASATPVIFLTTRGTPTVRQNARAAGCDDFLVKPVGLAALQTRINHVLHRRTVPPGRPLHPEGMASLSWVEHRLLRYLQANVCKMVSASDLLNACSYPDTSAAAALLYRYIGGLSQKLNADPTAAWYIQATGQGGYTLYPTLKLRGQPSVKPHRPAP